MSFLSKLFGRDKKSQKEKSFIFDLCFFYDYRKTAASALSMIRKIDGYVPTEEFKITKLSEGYAVEIHAKMIIPVAHQVIQKFLASDCNSDLYTIATDKSILKKFKRYVPTGIQIT